VADVRSRLSVGLGAGVTRWSLEDDFALKEARDVVDARCDEDDEDGDLGATQSSPFVL